MKRKTITGIIIFTVVIAIVSLASLLNSGNLNLSKLNNRVSFPFETPKECGLVGCHGLDISCGYNVPTACDTMYISGDNCRQLAKCQVSNGQCSVAKSPEFDSCKSCVEKCQMDYSDSELMFSECESKCGQINLTDQTTGSNTDIVKVKLFYYDPKTDPNSYECVANNYIEKELKQSESIIEDTILALIKSDVFEKNPNFSLTSSKLDSSGNLNLEFTSVPGFTTGGSCRIGAITSQIEKTALQFPEVKKVIFLPEDVFQP